MILPIKALDNAANTVTGCAPVALLVNSASVMIPWRHFIKPSYMVVMSKKGI